MITMALNGWTYIFIQFQLFFFVVQHLFWLAGLWLHLFSLFLKKKLKLVKSSYIKLFIFF
jgi:hypothetical protein